MNEREPKEDRLLDHNYDGIQEYDNPMPAWWVWIFWATIVYSVLYWLNVPGIGIGQGRLAAYEAEVARWQARPGASAPAAGAPAMSDHDLFVLSRDPVRVAAGKALFAEKCTPCHQADAGGSIGPNLTDDYWIHGNRPSQIYTIIDQGVLDKGMLNWGAQLEPEQMQSLVAYVLTLRGTRPASPKAPQGEPLAPYAEAAP